MRLPHRGHAKTWIENDEYFALLYSRKTVEEKTAHQLVLKR
jgi:hypothetical protein